MKLAVFSEYLARLEAVSSRLEMTAILAELYQALDSREVRPTSYLLQGRLVPEYQSLEFHVSTKLLLRVLARVKQQISGEAGSAATANLFGEVALETELQALEQSYKATGDLGEVAFEVVSARTSSATPLELVGVFERLTAIARDEGAGSQDRKVSDLADLLSQVSATSAKYLTRVVMGHLRLGFSTMTMIDSLSWAVTGSKAERSQLEDAFNTQADIGLIAEQYLSWRELSAERRLEQLSRLTVQLGVPVMPALCQRLNTSHEIIEKLGEVIAEPKYDGMRVQLHLDRSADQPVTIYTRSLEEVTPMFPELTAAVLEHLTVTACILDAEVIGYNSSTGELLPFQETSTRRRKHQVAETAAEIPVRFYVFDVLWIDGQSLVTEKLRARKERLEHLFKKNEVLLVAPYITTTDPEELRTYHEALLAQKLEGAVMKKIDAPYVSGRKGWSWVKIKEAEGTTGKLSDTLDLVVLGYYQGRGKRAQFGLGAVLLGVYDTDAKASEPTLKTIAKLGSGLTEPQLAEMKSLCDAVAAPTQPAEYDVPKELVPDVWCQPEIVVEVAADELTTSPRHTAGVALRFPRLVQRRSDKRWRDITTVSELAGLKR